MRKSITVEKSQLGALPFDDAGNVVSDCLQAAADAISGAALAFGRPAPMRYAQSTETTNTVDPAI